MMAGLEKPTKGEIIIDKTILKMNENKLAKFRQKTLDLYFNPII